MTVNRYHRGSASDHFDGERFFNPKTPRTDKTLLDILAWRLGSKPAKWPTSVPSRQVVPAAKVDGLSVTMIGHASVLMQVAGTNVLLDPVWSERVSPFTWAGPRRAHPPGIAFDKLPPIDVVLLTHNHYDHLDIPTLRRVWDGHRPPLLRRSAMTPWLRGQLHRFGSKRRIGERGSTSAPALSCTCCLRITGRLVCTAIGVWRSGRVSSSRHRWAWSMLSGHGVWRRQHIPGREAALPGGRSRPDSHWCLRAALVHEGPACESGRGGADHAGLRRTTGARGRLDGGIRQGWRGEPMPAVS